MNCCLAVGRQRSLPWQVGGALERAFNWQYEMKADGPGNVTWARMSYVSSHLGEPCLRYVWVKQWPHTLRLLTLDSFPGRPPLPSALSAIPSQSAPALVTSSWAQNPHHSPPWPPEHDLCSSLAFCAHMLLQREQDKKGRCDH